MLHSQSHFLKVCLSNQEVTVLEQPPHFFIYSRKCVIATHGSGILNHQYTKAPTAPAIARTLSRNKSNSVPLMCGAGVTSKRQSPPHFVQRIYASSLSWMNPRPLHASQ